METVAFSELCILASINISSYSQYKCQLAPPIIELIY